MTFIRNNVSGKQRKKLGFVSKCTWATSLLLLLQYGIVNSTVIKIELDTPAKDGKLNLTFNSNNENNSTTVDSELCKDPTFDAIFTFKDETLVLKGEKYWKLLNNGIAPGYPKPISEKWAGLPNDIDTAFTETNDRYIHFFKGSQHWKFDGDKLESGYPKPIKSDFSGIPDNLQAAAIWNGNDRLYLFKDVHYWNVDLSKRPYFVNEPTNMKYWIGIPSNLDAALRSSEYVTYFFKGGKYYKYNDKTESVEIDDPPYPKSVASNWFGCPKVIKVIEY